MGPNVKRTLQLLLLAFLLAACKSDPDIEHEYQGTDAGRIVIAIGAEPKTSYAYYSFIFRRVGGTERRTMTYVQDKIGAPQKRDYDNASENGVVLSFRLPPGQYEIYNLDIYMPGAMSYTHYYANKDFSIPFSVRPNETSYLGHYQANRIMGKNLLGLPLPAGAVFVVSSKQLADIDLLKKRLSAAALGTIVDATPNPKTIGNPIFVERIGN